MRVVLVANGPLASATEMRLYAESRASRLVVGVDGGTYHLLRLGIMPDVVTGDFDSLAESDRLHLAARGVHIFPTPDQDFTDLDKAIAAAIDDFGGTEIRIFAATAGRLDHVYSVLSAVVKYGRRADVRLVDEVGETFLVPGRVTLQDPTLPGRTLSLMAMGRTDGISTTGLRWPLFNEALAPGFRDGTLNEVISEIVTVEVARGDLLLMLHHAIL